MPTAATWWSLGCIVETLKVSGSSDVGRERGTEQELSLGAVIGSQHL